MILNRLSIIIGLTCLAMLPALVAVDSSYATTLMPAGNARLDAIVDRIQEHYRLTQTLGANFSEELSGISGSKRTRTGHVAYRKPGKFRWEFESPEKETIVSDGSTLYDYQPDLDQVLEMPLRQAFRSAAPVAFLLGFGDLQRDYETSLLSGTGSAPGLVRIGLVPRGGGDHVELGVDAKTYDLKTVKITDAIGNVTRISFSDVIRNAPLNDALFNFRIPSGADVIQAPQAQPRS